MASWRMPQRFHYTAFAVPAAPPTAATPAITAPFKPPPMHTAQKRTFDDYATDVDYLCEYFPSKPPDPQPELSKQRYTAMFSLKGVGHQLAYSQCLNAWREHRKVPPGAYVVEFEGEPHEPVSNEVRVTAHEKEQAAQLGRSASPRHKPLTGYKPKELQLLDLFDHPLGNGGDGSLRYFTKRNVRPIPRSKQPNPHYIPPHERPTGIPYDQLPEFGKLELAAKEAKQAIRQSKGEAAERIDHPLTKVTTSREKYDLLLKYFRELRDLAKTPSKTQLQEQIAAEQQQQPLEPEEQEEEEEPAIVPNITPTLTGDTAAKVDALHATYDERMTPMSEQQVIVNNENGLTVRDLGVSKPGTWLNDELVNVFLGVLEKRAWREQSFTKGRDKTPPVAVFSTHWVTTYEKRGWAGVSRWWKRQAIDERKLLQCPKVLFPVNSGSHWTLVHVNGLDKTITYYDSLGGAGQKYLNYVHDMVSNNLGVAYVESEWTVQAGTSGRQTNGNDCGVFMAMNAVALMMDLAPDIVIGDQHMTDARRLMCAVGMHNALLPEFDPYQHLSHDGQAANGTS